MSKKNMCFIEIMSDDAAISKEQDEVEKMIQFFLEQQHKTWGSQLKSAVTLGPTIDEEGNLEEVSGFEAFFHFISIGWKVFFAFIPPVKIFGGWVAFIIALAMIGFVTGIVGEFANLFGCVIGLKQAVTAITFVALGTSLPDTFASKQAAEQSDNADSAIGNVTGSNSVNVFLGLGLPWLIATLYWRQ